MLRPFLFTLPLLFVPALSQEIEKIDLSTPREVQIKLAKEAAPPEINERATIMVLGKRGYEVAVKGTNGFTCLVLRERPDTVEPECYDAEGSRTTLQADLFIEEQRTKGVAEETIKDQIEAATGVAASRRRRSPGSCICCRRTTASLIRSRSR